VGVALVVLLHLVQEGVMEQIQLYVQQQLPVVEVAAVHRALQNQG
tara:strand:- start:884 stop:1018 length:135 start_codon:yes stop_codon:yes gene_type:complete